MIGFTTYPVDIDQLNDKEKYLFGCQLNDKRWYVEKLISYQAYLSSQ